MSEKIIFLLLFTFSFTLTQAQHQHSFTPQDAGRVKEVMFENFHAKIYLPKIKLDKEFEIRVETQDMETHNPAESIKVFLNVNYSHPLDDKDEISIMREFEMAKPGKYFVREKLSRPGSYDLTVKLVDEQTGVEKEIVFEVELPKQKSFLRSMIDMHGAMMYGAVGIAIMIIMMAVKFFF